KGNQRQVIVFHLVQSDQMGPLSNAEPGSVPIESIPLESLADLRKKAMEASARPPQLPAKEARKVYFQRSEAVRRYVLARAAGICEACNEPAPFARPDGTPYLEPHHTRRLSDGGPDHPQFVAGICPTCHRRIHYGRDGSAWNDALTQRLEQV